MFPQRIQGSASQSRRGVALIIAISVLAILTIVVMGLATSFEAARVQTSHSAAREEAASIIRFGLGHAKALLAHSPGELVGKEKVVTLGGGKCVLSAKNAEPSNACYSGKFIKPRPGDVLVTIRAEGAKALSLTEEFLVNVSGAGSRVIRRSEKPGK
jgi:hypothetical protein